MTNYGEVRDRTDCLEATGLISWWAISATMCFSERPAMIPSLATRHCLRAKRETTPSTAVREMTCCREEAETISWREGVATMCCSENRGMVRIRRQETMTFMVGLGMIA